jgi:hypothetical protein
VTVREDPLLSELRELISQYGWAVRQVLEDAHAGLAPFSYTVGLTAFDHPEIVITGMPFEPARAFLNLAGEAVRGGYRFRPGTRDGSLTDSGDVAFVDVVETGGLHAVEQVYGEIRALQLIWPDSAGVYPWEPGFRNPPEVQPLWGPIPSDWSDSP